MTVARSVAEVLSEHVVLEHECIDRMYLNLYVPRLQYTAGCAHFWLLHRGHRFASSALMAPMSRSFVSRVEDFALREGIDLFTFERGERKEDVAKEYLADFLREEGVLFIGKAQEKIKTVRTERRYDEHGPYPWLVMSTAVVNQYYCYVLDDNFGPMFIKLSSYFPYNGKVCLNGHEYVKRQLQKRNIGYEALDNGILSCDDPQALRKVSESLTAERIERVVRKWLRRLPHPFSPKDQQAGYCHDISILQAEFSLTQVLDRPLTGRVFFEEIIRENLDAGRPDQVQLIFGRRVSRRTPGRFRTRVLTEDVVPSLHVDYKHSRIKQYHKEGRALRTETTINDTNDFSIRKRLHNLSALRKVGFSANRRLLDVQRISHDCKIGQVLFDRIQQPVTVHRQRAAGLRFGDPRVMALLSALLVFRLLPRGFSNKDLRAHVGPLLGLEPGQLTQGMMTYDLRRLRLHRLIERIPRSHRYRMTVFGARAATFLTRLHARLLRPGLALVHGRAPPTSTRLRKAVDAVDAAIHHAWNTGRIAA
jgi:hypothetical protein